MVSATRTRGPCSAIAAAALRRIGRVNPLKHLGHLGAVFFRQECEGKQDRLHGFKRFIKKWMFSPNPGHRRTEAPSFVAFTKAHMLA